MAAETSQKSKLTPIMAKRLKAKYPSSLVDEFVWWCRPKWPQAPPQGITGIIIFSGANKIEVLTGKETKETIKLATENLERIYWGRVIYQSIYGNGRIPAFIVNGITNQLKEMSNIAQRLGIPKRQIHRVDCGKSAHTGIQAELMLADQKWSSGQIVVMSSDYHMPRVIRTVVKYWPLNVFRYSGAPSTTVEDYEAVVEGEIERILRYSAEEKIATSVNLAGENHILDYLL